MLAFSPSIVIRSESSLLDREIELAEQYSPCSFSGWLRVASLVIVKSYIFSLNLIVSQFTSCRASLAVDLSRPVITKDGK